MFFDKIMSTNDHFYYQINDHHNDLIMHIMFEFLTAEPSKHFSRTVKNYFQTLIMILIQVVKLF